MVGGIGEGVFPAESYAEKAGRSLVWVSSRLEIAQMPDYMQQALSEQKINLGVALELYLIKDANTCQRYFFEAVRSGMSNHAAKVIRLQMNEAIEALQDQGQAVTAETLPAITTVPRVPCELTGALLPINETRMIRVGVRPFEIYQARRSEVVENLFSTT